MVYVLNLMLWFGHKNMSLVGVGNSKLMNNYQFFNTYFAIHLCPWDQIFACPTSIYIVHLKGRLHVTALLCSVVDSYNPV